MHTRTDTTRLLTPSNARKKGESSGDARVVSEGDRIPAAATRKPCCAGPTAATGQKRPVATAARCTRRFAPDACDESRNHSPNQMVRHVPPRPNALPVPLPSREKMKTEARLKRRHGRRIPRLRATRSRAPRASRSRGRAGARPRLRASAPATSRPLAPARSHRCCGLAKLRPRNRAPAPPPAAPEPLRSRRRDSALRDGLNATAAATRAADAPLELVVVGAGPAGLAVVSPSSRGSHATRARAAPPPPSSGSGGTPCSSARESSTPPAPGSRSGGASWARRASRSCDRRPSSTLTPRASSTTRCSPLLGPSVGLLSWRLCGVAPTAGRRRRPPSSTTSARRWWRATSAAGRSTAA